MSAPPDWQRRLERFFVGRASLVGRVPTLEDHCLISSKDPRIWTKPEAHRALIDSLQRELALTTDSEVLEVGCASGFIACGLAGRVRRYVGVDLAEPSLAVARSMQLPNAEFRRSDGGALPFADGAFDAAFAYDVFTNFPNFSDGVPLLGEMVRVVKPGGWAMVGSLTRRSTYDAFVKHAAEVSRRLEETDGPWVQVAMPELPSNDPLSSVAPQVVTYNFDPGDFVEWALDRGIDVLVTRVHPENPYHQFRFNVLLAKR